MKNKATHKAAAPVLRVNENVSWKNKLPNGLTSSGSNAIVNTGVI